MRFLRAGGLRREACSSSSRLRRSARSRARRSARVGSRGVVFSSCDAYGRGAGSPPSVPTPGPPGRRCRRVPSFRLPRRLSAATLSIAASPHSHSATTDIAAWRSGPATRRRSPPIHVTLRHHRSEERTARPPVPTPRVQNPNFLASTGGNRVARSTPPTGRRDTPGPLHGVAVGNGMMTVVMDHRNAPRAGPPGHPSPLPASTAHPAVPGCVLPRRVRRARRLAAGVLVGRADDAGRGARSTPSPAPRCRCSARSPPCLRRRAGRSSPRCALPPATPGTCLSWTRAGRRRTPGRRLRAGPPVRAGRHGARWPTRPTLPDDGRWRQLVNERCDPVVKQLPERPVRPGRPVPDRGAQAVAREVGAGRPRAALRPAERVALGRAVPDRGQGRRAGPGGGARARAPAWASTDARSATRSTATGPHAVEAVGVVDLAQKFDADAFPAVDDQDGFLQPECTKVATEYAGGDEVIARQEADRLLGQPHRGVLEGGHPQGQLQPGRAAARPQRVRARDRARSGAR